MPIAEPTDSPLWAAVQGRVRWPTADEDVTALLGRDWDDAVAAFQFAATSTKELPETAWPDEVGAVFDERIASLRDRVSKDAERMGRLARITSAYSDDVRYTKGEIIRILGPWDEAYRTTPEVAEGFAGLINTFLQAMANRILARGEAGPDDTDSARPSIPTPRDVVAEPAAPPPPPRPPGTPPPPRDIERFSQQQQGHVRGTPQYELRIKQGKPTSYFLSQNDANRYTYDAWYKGRPVGGDPYVRELDFGRPIGIGGFGGRQTRVTARMDANGHVHGHPSGPEI
jgi:hypothetical protein